MILLYQPFQNRSIPFAFRRARGCVCLVGFASLQSPWAHTLKASLPCLPLPLRRTTPSPQPPQKHNHSSPIATPILNFRRKAAPQLFIIHSSFFIFHFSLIISPLDTSQIIWYYNLNYSFKKNRSFSQFFYTYFNVFADIL